MIFSTTSVFAVRRLDLLGEKFDFDGRFVQAMRGRAVLLGYAFDKSARVEGRLPPSAAFYSDGGGEIASGGLQRLSKNLNYYRGYRGNLEELLDASSGAGHVNFIDDSDGFVRRSPMVVSHAKKIMNRWRWRFCSAPTIPAKLCALSPRATRPTAATLIR